MIERAYKELKELSVQPDAQEMARQRELALINRRVEVAETFEDGKAEGLLLVLVSRGFEITDETREKILSCRDLETLDEWTRLAVTAKTIDNVFR